MIADLHLHTNCSDGKLNVVNTIKIANDNGISLLSVTDHDTLFGVKKAIQLSQSYGITCISGLELSCRNENENIAFPQDISIHILAYNINYDNKELNSHLKQYHKQRKQILEDLLIELAENDFDVNYGDICVIAGTQMRIQDIINHINSSFICNDKKECLIEIANSYYPRLFQRDNTLHDAIHLIKRSGGIAVLAHAFFSYRDYNVIKNSQSNVSDLLDYLCALGLDGVEVYYSRFDSQQVDWLLNEAQERGLIITAGSDFHGTPQRKAMINYEIEQLTNTTKLLLDSNRYRF